MLDAKAETYDNIFQFLSISDLVKTCSDMGVSIPPFNSLTLASNRIFSVIYYIHYTSILPNVN